MKKIQTVVAFIISTSLVVAIFFALTAPASAATEGPRLASSAANVTGVGSTAWSGAANIFGAGNATAVLGNNGSSNYLQATGFGFSIPANAIINGIQVSVNRSSSANTGGNSVQDNRIRLVKGGTIQSTDKSSASDWPTSLASTTYGNTSDLWGTTWTPADINASNFGFALSALNQSGFSSRTASVDAISITVTYTIDTTAPTLSQVTAVPTLTNDTTPNYTFSSSEAGTIVYGGDCSSADTTANSGNNIQTFNALSAGLHDNCTITVIDTAGNTSTPLAVNAFTIDTTAPTVTINQGATQADPANAAPVVFDVVFSEPTTNFVTGDVTITGTTGGTKTATVSGSGTNYTVSVTGMTTSGTVIANINANAATDAAGNGNTAATVTDNTVQYNNPTHDITASAGAGGTITPSGTVSVNQGSTQAFTIVPNTGNIVSDVVVDAVSVGRPQLVTFTNVTAPHTVSASFDGGWTAPSGNANVNSVNNPTSGYVSDNASIIFNNGGDSIDLTNFAQIIPAGAVIDGIQVAAEHNRDAGSTRSFTAALSWNNGTNFTTTKTIAGSDATTTTVVGGTSDTWGRSWTASELANGTFRIRVTSSTGGSNIYLDQIQVKVSYTLDTTAPAGGSMSYADGYVTTASVPMTYTLGTDAQSGINAASGKIQRASASLSGGTCGAFGSFSDLVTESDGSYTDTSVVNGNCYQYQYVISDNAGNASTYTSSNIVKVDTAVPSTTIDANSLGIVNNALTKQTSISFDFTGTDAESGVVLSECSLDAAAYATCASPIAYTSLGDGIHIVNIRSTDAAGNVESTATFSWEVDATAPTIARTGDADVTVLYGDTYTDQGATANDTRDGDITASIVTVNPVDTNTLGDYTVTYDVTDAAGNTASQVTRTVHVVQREVTVTADAQTKVYGDTDPTLTYQVSGDTIISGDLFTGSLIREVGEDVGTYAIEQGTLSLGAKYDITYVGADFDITKRTLAVTATADDKDYDGTTDAVATLSDNRLSGDDITVAYTSASFDTANVGTDKTVTISGITVTGPDAGNYDWNADTTATADITKADATIALSDLSYTYDASAHGATVETTPSGLSYSITYAGNPTEPTAAGTYPVHAEITDPNYMGSADDTLTIAKKALTITANDDTKVYDDSAYTDGNGVVFDGFAVGEDESALSGSLVYAGDAQGAVDTGHYAIVPTGYTSGNYEIAYVAGDLFISERPITVTADAKTKTYGDTDPALTYVVTSGEIVGDDELTGELAREAGEDIGTYAILQGTLSNNGNYDMTFVPGVFTINAKQVTVTPNAGQSKVYGDAEPADYDYTVTPDLVGTDAFTGTLARNAGESVGTYAITQGDLALSANYDFVFTPGVTFAITKAPLTITVDDSSKTFGEANPAFSSTITGFTGADSDESDLDTAITYTTLADETSAAGEYEVTASADDQNYTITFVPGTLTVTEKELTVTADAQTKTYGDTDPTFTYTVDGLENGDLAENVLTGVLSRDGGENIGTYAITEGTLVANANYDLTFVAADLTITPASLTITPNNQTKQYGTTFTFLGTEFTTSPLIPGDSVDSVTLQSDGAAANAAATTYRITATDAVGTGVSNYDITYAEGDMEVTVGSATITATDASKVYGDADPTFTYTVNGLENGETDVDGAPTCEVVGEHTNVGTYEIVCSGASDSDYDIAYVSGTLTIEKRPITVSALPDTKLYDGTTDGSVDPEVTDGTIAFDNQPNFTQSFDTKNIGTNKTVTPAGVVLDGNDGNNYDVTFVSRTDGEITPPNALIISEITASDKVYNGTTDATIDVSGVSVDGIASGDDVALDTTGATGAFDTADVGTDKTVTISGLTLTGADAVNYTIAPVTTLADISKRPLAVTAIANDKEYDDTTNATASLSHDGLLGDDIDVDAATASFDTANVGTDKTVTVSVSVTGPDAGNYEVPATVTALADITKAAITITAITNTKPFDGTTSAAATPNVDGLKGDDTVTGLVETYDTANVGTGKTLTVTAYTVNDGNAGGNYDVFLVANTTGVITNTAPTAGNDSASVDEDGSVDIAVLGNDSDPENDTLTPVIVDTPTHGGVTVNPSGTITYTPTANYNGTDSFTYIANDGSVDSNVATVSITVNPTADDATVTVTSALVTYDTTAKSVTVTTVPSGLSVDVTYNGNATLPVNAGLYNVVATVNDAIYSGSATGSLVIEKAQVSVTADDKTITVGDADPVFTFAYGSFQGSDAAQDIDTTPTCTVSGAHTAPGTYPIVCSGGADGNYSFVYTNGTLTVNDLPAPVITSEQASNATVNSITVTWTTDHPATSRVVYDTVPHGSVGSAPNYGYASSTNEDSNLTTNHSVVVTGLTPATTYYFRGVSHGSPESVSNEVTLATLTPAPTTGSLQVSKTANGGDGTFNFTGDAGSFQIATNGNSGTTTISNLTPGSYSVTETAQSGWTLNANTCTNVTVTAGQVATCTVTNTKDTIVTPTTGGLIVSKTANGGNGTFNFTGNAGSFQITTTGGVGSRAISNLTPGSYTVTETAQSGWTMNSNTCTNVTVSAGATATCQVVNTKNATTTPNEFGKLKVVKKTVGGRGAFTFNGGTLGTFEISTSWGEGSKTFKKVPTGTYSITETVPAGWTMTSNTCENVTVVNGQTVTCTITNTKNPPAPRGGIGGIVYNDKAADGVKNGTDSGILGMVVYIDSNNNGSWNFGESIDYTNFAGEWFFGNLPAGTYRVRVASFFGWFRTEPVGGVQVITIAPGEFNETNNFGFSKRRPQSVATTSFRLDTASSTDEVATTTDATTTPETSDAPVEESTDTEVEEPTDTPTDTPTETPTETPTDAPSTPSTDTSTTTPSEGSGQVSDEHSNGNGWQRPDNERRWWGFGSRFNRRGR